MTLFPHRNNFHDIRLCPGPNVLGYDHGEFNELFAKFHTATAPKPPLPSKPTYYRNIAKVFRTQQQNRPDDSRKDATHVSEANGPTKEQNEEGIMERARPQSILKKDSQYGPLLEDEKIHILNHKENAITHKPGVNQKASMCFQPCLAERWPQRNELK